MKVQNWIFSINYEYLEGRRDLRRFAVVGAGHSGTVERALCLAGVSGKARAEIYTDPIVRKFVEGLLDPEHPDMFGYSTRCPIGEEPGWVICISSVHEIIS